VYENQNKKLLLCFLVHSLGAAPLAELLKFNLALNKLFILAGPVVYALALGAAKLYESVL
jgi:hypothetical protein